MGTGDVAMWRYMFKYFPASRLLWFQLELLRVRHRVIGILLGIAIYNSIIVDFRMPMVIHKKLKGESVTLQEPRRAPDLASDWNNSSFSGDVQSAFQFNFQISHESLGEMIRTIDLKENGAEVPVTNQNREEDVSL